MKKNKTLIFTIVLSLITLSIYFMVMKKTYTQPSSGGNSSNEYFENIKEPQNINEENPSSETESEISYNFVDGLPRTLSASAYFYNKENNIKVYRSYKDADSPHSYYEYKIEYNGRDITPPEFRTIEGPDCSLQKFQFIFTPVFSVIKISRPWEESWITPTMATKTVYKMQSGELVIDSETPLKSVCDVSELF